MKTALRIDDSKFGIVFLAMKGVPNKFIKPERPLGFLQHPMAAYTYAREFYVPIYEVQKDGPKKNSAPPYSGNRISSPAKMEKQNFLSMHQTS